MLLRQMPGLKYDGTTKLRWIFLFFFVSLSRTRMERLYFPGAAVKDFWEILEAPPATV